jgi:hypothetical protein
MGSHRQIILENVHRDRITAPPAWRRLRAVYAYRCMVAARGLVPY